MKILVVEDDNWWAENTARTLEKLKHQVVTVSHAVGAIEVIDGFQPEALILDMILTGETGMALLHELQTYHDTSKLPVILMSSLDNLNLDDLIPYGVKRILDKATMEPGDLAAAVNAL